MLAKWFMFEKMTTAVAYVRHSTFRAAATMMPLLLLIFVMLGDSRRSSILPSHVIQAEATISRHTMQKGSDGTVEPAKANSLPPLAREISPPVLELSPKISRGAQRRVKLGRRTPNCASRGAQAKSFIMVFMGHSGSSAILSELGAHKNIYFEEPEPLDHDSIAQNTSAALIYARTFFKRVIETGRVPGFKMRPMHIRRRPAEWAALAKEFDTRIIWQYRSNIVKQAVGEYSYHYLHDMSVLEGLKSEKQMRERCQSGAGCRFRVDDMKFLHGMLTNCVHSDDVIAHAVHLISGGSDVSEGDERCVFELPYEDYLYDRQGTMRDIFKFLDVPFQETKPSRFKATGDSMCEVVENWDEVCRNFYGCHVWRDMFDDERNGCACNTAGGSLQFCDATYQG